MAMRAGDILFLDTNILLIATDEGREDHNLGTNVFPHALSNGIHLALSGQVIREYLVVATRPLGNNGLGLGIGDALHNIEEIKKRTLLCEETEEVSDQLKMLVRKYDIVGKKIHDANIAATMLAHGADYLLTENKDDFKQFSFIETIRLKDFI
jgi:predicted nucleic acid-binding protein